MRDGRALQRRLNGSQCGIPVQMVQSPHGGRLELCVDQSEGGPEGGQATSVPPAMAVGKGEAG